ncbi:MAG: hypothetical protein ALECFALPRED_008377 [Alectoria fallacina]|uniref:Uncharacterized protein n=1 Tax=Alectoria fallacina TaxID=1903189 RepID=A0A8H3J3A3_9LECA|nr:MAG: hypothetical protein ALECFALPRED_008377 [Alectoria fallacina]
MNPISPWHLMREFLGAALFQSPQNAELLRLTLRLETELEAPGLSVHDGSIYEIMRVANTLKDDQSIRKITGLARVIHTAEYDHTAGNDLLDLAIDESLDNIAKSLIEGHLMDVAKGKFEWLHEVKDLGCSTKEMLGFLQVSDPYIQESNCLVTSNDANPEGDHPGELDPKLHQNHCVHEGGSEINQLRTLTDLRPRFDWEQCASDRNEILRVVSAYCGFAGVIPDWKSGTIFAGRIEFFGSGASVWVSDGQEWVENEMTSTEEDKKHGEMDSGSNQGSGKTEKRGAQQVLNDEVVASHENKMPIQRSGQPAHLSNLSLATSKENRHEGNEGSENSLHTVSGMSGFGTSFDNPRSIIREGKSTGSIAPPTQSLSSAQTLQMEPKSRYSLTDSEMKIVDFLKEATTRICSAAKVLQNKSFCCNAFTIIILRESSNVRDHIVDLVSISFETLKDLRDSMSAIRIESTGGLPSIQGEGLTRCSTIGLKLLGIFSRAVSSLQSPHGGPFPDSSVISHLHICSLVTQFLGLGLAFYTQAHLGPYSPFFLENPLTDMTLAGTMHSSMIIKACLRKLTCLGEMVRGPVFVFELLYHGPISSVSRSNDTTFDLCGRGVDIAETWGPGLLISNPGTTYGHRVYAIEIGGGVIRRGSTHEHMAEPLYHWSPQYESYDRMRRQGTFNLWDGIRIGGIRTRLACPLDPERCRQQSQQFLSYLGTETNYWELAERQVALQAGYYTVLQLGNTYVRKFGITVKQQIIEQWSLMPHINMLDVPWGLQVSLCTGVARRVSLRTLIEGSLLTQIDTLQHDQWQKILPKAQAAFRGSIDLDSWIEELNANEKSCLISIIAYVLGVLKHTGMDREGKLLSILWPHKPNLSYGIKLRCRGENSWTRILHDSESCATFAAVTSLCFEGHNHECRNLAAPLWLKAGGVLSTAVCPDLTAGKYTAATSSQLRLEEGQRYWFGKIGGEHYVVVRKTKDGDVYLFVRRNRIPKAVAQKVVGRNVLREKPDVTFEAVDVLVLGDEGGH